MSTIISSEWYYNYRPSFSFKHFEQNYYWYNLSKIKSSECGNLTVYDTKLIAIYLYIRWFVEKGSNDNHRHCRTKPMHLFIIISAWIAHLQLTPRFLFTFLSKWKEINERKIIIPWKIVNFNALVLFNLHLIDKV